MSLKRLEENLDKMEAIQNYPSLKQKAWELEEELRKTSDELKRVKALLKKKEQIQVTYNLKEYTLEEFQDLVEKEAKKERALSEWNARKNHLVNQALLETLENHPNIDDAKRRILQQKIGEEADKQLKNPAKWPGWFKKLYNQEVQYEATVGIPSGLSLPLALGM